MVEVEVMVIKPSNSGNARTMAPYQPVLCVRKERANFTNKAPARIVLITPLNSYQGRWTIKVHATSKNELKRFKLQSAEGDGKVFSFDMLDVDG